MKKNEKNEKNEINEKKIQSGYFLLHPDEWEHSILKTLPDPIVLYDKEGRVVYVNPPFSNLFGWTLEELLGKKVDFVPDDDWSATLKKIENLKQGKIVSDFITHRKTKDGSIIDISISSSPLYNSEGNFTSIISIHRDISARKRAENALRDSEERYRTILEAVPDPVVLYDMDGNVIYINPAFTHVFGWTLEELLGKKVDFVPDDVWPETLMKIEQLKRGENFIGFETKRYNKNKEIIDISMSAAVWRDLNGKPMGSVINLRDITENKKMEAQLRHAQKMEAVGTLAGGVAHDFNNILQGISGYVQLILSKKEKGGPDHDKLIKIDRATQRAAELIKQLLTVSRKMESRLEPVNLNQKITEICKLLERIIPRMIKIELQFTDDLKMVNADSTQLEQIILNLGNNAKDAMQDNGKLIFETKNVKKDDNIHHTYPEFEPQDYVLLSVTDTGKGMDKETEEQIFDPFFTTKGIGEGTGLGLSTVYGIVKNHGGYIKCFSKQGEGTSFKIYFPALNVMKNKDVEGPEEKNEMPRGDETVLIVDDEEFLLDIAGTMLKEAGYSTMQAGSGEEAIEIYKNECNRIDLVILDLSMPGMGGHKCRTKLMEINSDIKIIISSGYSDLIQHKEIYDSEKSGFISKPYRLYTMLKEVRRILDSE